MQKAANECTGVTSSKAGSWKAEFQFQDTYYFFNWEQVLKTQD